MKRFITRLALPVLALLIALPGISLAQEPVKHEKDTVTVKATIDAIDHDTRVVTLKDKDGKITQITAGPEVRRFDELKVGDVVTFVINESVVYTIRKPGESVPPDKKDDPAIVRDAAAKPGGSKTTQETKTVTIKAIDPKTSAVTIQTEDGKTSTHKVNDKNIVKNIKVGDRVVIIYTKAVAISIE
jgi:Cu/Ag efflux protein CusF